MQTYLIDTLHIDLLVRSFLLTVKSSIPRDAKAVLSPFKVRLASLRPAAASDVTSSGLVDMALDCYRWWIYLRDAVRGRN